MKTNFLTLCILSLLTFITITSCSSSEGEGNGGDDADASGGQSNIRLIAGTSAIGAPGSYSNNCLGTSCARADSDGVYLLSAEATTSSLLSSEIPFSDGTTNVLYSRYRHDDALTSALVNINPTTHALLDAWAVHSESSPPNDIVTIDLCAENTTCANRLADSFSDEIEQTMLARLKELLGDAYPTDRNPFDDIYIADNTDDLDVMHDHLNFIVTATDLEVHDNNGQLLTVTTIAALIQSEDLSASVITDEQWDDAQSIDPAAIGGSSIDINLRTSPNTTQDAPVDFVINVGSSSSDNPPLSFTHDLTLASGTTQSFVGDTVEVTIDEGGQHIWVVTATDTAGNTLSEGQELNVLGTGSGTPIYGGAGSCLTPSPLNANSQNTCQESQNGSLFECDIINSGSVTLISSPVPCAREVQNEGELYGVCTLSDIELRVFTYENPTRNNNVETFTEAQTRVSEQCSTVLEGDWATQP